jgi:hypothetical protein
MKYPIGLSIILNALAAISILSGCSDYLDREYDSFIDNEMTFTSYERTSKFLVNAYRYLPETRLLMTTLYLKNRSRYCYKSGRTDNVRSHSDCFQPVR